MGDRLSGIFLRMAMSIFFFFLILLFATCVFAQKDVLIVGDVSGSMKGFAVKAPKQLQTIYKVVLRNSKGLSSNPVVAKMPGKDSTVQEIPIGDWSIFTNVKSYTGQTTPLADVISHKSNEYSTLYILTDGIESDNLYLRLQEAMVQLAQKDWGIWILLFPVEYEGTLDIEQPIIPDVQLPQIKQCIQEQNPEWQVTVKPEAKRSLDFKGSRGLLLFVFAKDATGGRNQVNLLANDLRAELNTPQVVELSPLHLRQYTIPSIEPESLGVQVLSGANGEHTIVTDPDNGDTFKKLLLKVAWKEPPAAFPQSIEEKWLLNKEPTEWSDLSIIGDSGSDLSPGDLALSVNSERTWSEWLWSLVSPTPSLRNTSLSFSVSSVLRPIQTGWWHEWSTDTTWRCPQKVFKLEGLVNSVTETARQRRMEIPSNEHHRLRLQIGTN